MGVISCWHKYICFSCFRCPKFAFFSIRVFFHRHWRFTGQHGRGGDHRLFQYTTSTRSWTLRHLFATFYMWDDYHIFSIATLVFTRLLLDETNLLIELPFDWLIDDAIFVCLLDELILGFCYSDLKWKPVDLNSHRLSPLYYKRPD